MCLHFYESLLSPLSFTLYPLVKKKNQGCAYFQNSEFININSNVAHIM